MGDNGGSAEAKAALMKELGEIKSLESGSTAYGSFVDSLNNYRQEKQRYPLTIKALRDLYLDNGGVIVTKNEGKAHPVSKDWLCKKLDSILEGNDGYGKGGSSGSARKRKRKANSTSAGDGGRGSSRYGSGDAVATFIAHLDQFSTNPKKLRQDAFDRLVKANEVLENLANNSPIYGIVQEEFTLRKAEWEEAKRNSSTQK